MTPTRIALVLAAVLVLGAVAFAARPEPVVTPEQRVERLAAELRCPVCQGLSVASSPTGMAREMRDLIAQRVREGRSDAEIRAEFRASYGDWVFLTPPSEGPGALMWLLPLALVGAGALVAWRRAGGRRAEDAEPAPSPADVAALRERVRREEALEG